MEGGEGKELGRVCAIWVMVVGDGREGGGEGCCLGWMEALIGSG